MTAIFSLELSQEPQYVDLLDVAAGYGSLSVPVTDLLSGDAVDAMYLTIQGDGLATISAVIDQIQRAQGFYEWTDSESVDGHFTLSAAQTAAIAAATSCTYSVQVQITRSGSSYTREVQSGNINARPAIPSGPLIVASVSVTGGPVIGGINSTTQLAAVARDSFNAIVPGVAFSWTTADASIATVSAAGLVTIHALGATTIFATASGVFGSTIATGTVTPFAVGSIPYASSISAISMLPIGTPNQYLRTNAGATAPEWDTLTAADIGPGVFQTGDFTFGGNVLFGTDNTFDIGGAGINRPRDLKLGRNIVVGGTTSLGGIVYTWPGSQSANKVLKTDGAGTLSWATPTEEIALTDLTDVTIAGAANGQVLRYNSGTSLWENSTVGTQLTALNATELTSGTVPNARLAGAYTGITGLGTLGSDLLFTDATFDIGKVGATRPRDVFASRNVTIGGTIAVTGASTFGVVGAGATTVTTLHASSTSALDGDVTLGARLVFSALAGKIVPGATSISLRNSADGADNVLILDSGAVTFRSTVGGITTLTATSIGGTLTTAAQPNVTSLGTIAANLLFVDASFDIGQSGITRPRHGYFSGNVTAGSTFIGALANTLTIGTHLTGGSFNNSGNITIATDAVSTNAVSTIVARDGSGNFAAGTITASLTGAASLNLLLTGGTLTGALLFTDNTFDIGASGLTRPRSGFFGTNVTVGGVFIGTLNKTLTFGAHLISGGASFNNSADVTITSDATSANTISTIVARDTSGNFSAGTITATLVGAAAAGSLSGATLAAGVTASSLTSFGTLAADLLFTDALYDIGKTGATRPRDVFLSRNLTIGGTATLGSLSIGTLAITGASINLGSNGSGLNSAAVGFVVSAPVSTGNATPATLTFQTAHVTISGSSLQTLESILILGDRAITALSTSTFTLGASSITTTTITGTNLTGTLTTAAQANITSVGALVGGSIAAGFAGASFGGNVIATADATYDLGASGASRFRDLFLSRNATIGGSITGTIANFSGIVSLNLSGNAFINVNSGASGGSAAYIAHQLSSSNKWYAGLNVFAINGHYDIYDAATSALAMSIAPGANPAVAFNGALSGITTLTTTTQVIAPQLTGSNGVNLDINIQPGGASGRIVFRSNVSGETVVISNAGAISGITTLVATTSLAASSGASAGLIYLGSDASTYIQRIDASWGANRVGINGHVIAAGDATFDIGNAGANRFRDLFLSRNALIGGSVTTTVGDITSGGQIVSTGNTVVASGGAGKLVVGNMATTNSNNMNACITNSTAPSGNPTGGGFLWVEAGALKFRGSSGTVTAIAPA